MILVSRIRQFAPVGTMDAKYAVKVFSGEYRKRYIGEMPQLKGMPVLREAQDLNRQAVTISEEKVRRDKQKKRI